MSTNYSLKRIGTGWQVTQRGTRVTGWGSRPELALRDYRLQSRLQAKYEKRAS